MIGLKWMVWTVPTAIFFGVIGLMLVVMTVWQILAPSLERKGFLPIPTTPGDRLFIGLVTSGFGFLAWLGLTQASLWIAFAMALVWLTIVMRWG